MVMAFRSHSVGAGRAARPNPTTDRLAHGRRNADPASRPLECADFTEEDLPDLTGRTIVFTGADGHLGSRTVQELTQHGADIVLTCRSRERGESALEAVRKADPNARPKLVRLDLADPRSIRLAAERIGELVGSVDVLVNNAGVMGIMHTETADGHELQFAVNHLGHFALTGLLLPLLHRSPSARVVTVGSINHNDAMLRLDDVDYKRRHYTGMGAYAQSKLANMLFSAELSRRFDAAGWNAISLAAHPGAAATGRYETVMPGFTNVREFFRYAVSGFANPVDEANRSMLYAIAMPDVVNDDYLGPRQLGGIRGPVARAPRSRSAMDPGLAARLWDLAVDLTGVDYAELAVRG
ncbi:MAG: SDR family NAD(P)-dependent oxidoreductase [Tomitella sp.]|nr:SDR family NAD(P)-dependent oxidoreductase [Tomitella sp.]